VSNAYEPGSERSNLPQVAPQGVLEPAGGYGYAGRYPDFGPAQPDFASQVRDYLTICRRRRWLIAGVFFSVVALAVLYTLIATPHYTATIRLQIDRTASKVVEKGEVSTLESADMDFLKTQYELLQSRSLAERVVSTAKLADDEDFLKGGSSPIGQLLALFKGPADERKALASQQAAERVVDRRAVKPLPGSRLVDVSFTDPNPVRAQRDRKSVV
jgi:succinoglycan biosynthesis transport protein ExoP